MTGFVFSTYARWALICRPQCYSVLSVRGVLFKVGLARMFWKRRSVSTDWDKGGKDIQRMEDRNDGMSCESASRLTVIAARHFGEYAVDASRRHESQ